MSHAYSKSGVNYDYLDPVKRLGQKLGHETAANLKNTLWKELGESRGESAYIIEDKDKYYATVIEGLGTKNLVADEMRKVTGKTYYDAIAYDTVAATVNDLITVGARPLSVMAYWAAGESEWWKDEERLKDLAKGWKKACDDADCTWGGGETPSMTDIVYPKTINLVGSGFGIIKPKERLILGDNIKHGDCILFLASNGIHANGLSLARKIAGKLKNGYKEELSNGVYFGESLLRPTILYSRLINEALDAGIKIHYMVNITGHGWRKLMRYPKAFTYAIDEVPRVSPLFSFIKDKAKLNDREMYETFNMDAGFALFLNEKYAGRIFSLAKKNNIRAWVGGYIQKGPKQVVIKPLNITYSEKELNIR